MDALKDLQEQKNELVKEIRTLADKFNDNGKKWENDEQRAAFDKVNEDHDSLVEQMDELREAARVAARAEAVAEKIDRQKHARSTEVGEARQNRAGVVTEEHRAMALQAWMRSNNEMELTDAHEEACHIAGVNPTKSRFEATRRGMTSVHGLAMWQRGGKPLPADIERRALSVGTDSEGGYTVPEGFSNELERSMLAFGGPRQVCRIVTTMTGNDLPWPTANDTGNVGALLAENASIGASTDPTFGVVTFNAYKYSSKPVLVSQELLEDSAFNMAQLLGSMLGERIGRITAQHFTTGTGSSQPNGLTTAAGAGVTAAGAAAITADELIDLVHSLDPAYRSMDSTGFMFEDATLKAIRKLKDGDNQYLWQPGLQSSEPDMLLGFPYTVNQDMPAMTTGNISVLFGTFSKYIIRDVAQVRFYRLEERYRDNDQTGFIMFSRHDGDLLDAGTDPMKKLTQA